MILSEGISRVRVLPLPVGVGSDGTAEQLTGFAVVKWHSAYVNLLHQVYIDGRFAGVTSECSQRQMIVPLPASGANANRIEVFAVDYADADTDFSETVGSGQIQSRVRIEFPKVMDGNVDFYAGDSKLNRGEIKIRGEYWEKCGFGTGSFGDNDFGFDRNAAVGFGKGNFGLAWFGFDCELFGWTSGQLASGNYEFKVVTTDENGNETQTETESIIIIGQAEPAEKLAIKSFDKQTNRLILETIGD